MINLRIWGKAGVEEIEVNENDIVNFRITNRKEYTKKGDFKRFVKWYYVQVADKLYTIGEYQFKTLKEILKGKYKATKSTETEWKNYTEKKATDWTYRIN